MMTSELVERKIVELVQKEKELRNIEGEIIKLTAQIEAKLGASLDPSVDLSVLISEYESDLASIEKEIADNEEEAKHV